MDAETQERAALVGVDPAAQPTARCAATPPGRTLAAHTSRPTGPLAELLPRQAGRRRREAFPRPGTARPRGATGRGSPTAWGRPPGPPGTKRGVSPSARIPHGPVEPV